MSNMKNSLSNAAIYTAVGMIVGAVAGATVSMTMKKPKNTFRRKAADAMDTVGAVMHSIADYID